jgi:gamma-glutamyltranspeptidase/glutathione hydrolase
LAGKKGVAASGSAGTTGAAIEILKAGGNAFDAALGGLCAACVAEPLLASLGGGGFLVALPGQGKPLVFDFFCQTPFTKCKGEDIDFYPIVADFGTAEQEFHIGMGSIAVPGVVAGLFDAHRALGQMPIAEVMTPAIERARQGTVLDAFHHYITRILRPILEDNPGSRALYQSPSDPARLVGEGERQVLPGLADALDVLAHEGPDLLYRGEWARQIVKDCAEQGGLLTLEDLSAYRVEHREPAVFRYRGARCAINPPPSPGGCLVALSLRVMAEFDPGSCNWGSEGHVLELLRGMRAANLARQEPEFASEVLEGQLEPFLGAANAARWRQALPLRNLFSRGTTHISVADEAGNIASLTTSNGEGCGYVLPGTGIMLNNMLGEEDLNPGGFHRWDTGTRLASMMSPALLETADGVRHALGSGGSNRIRSAMTQVLSNLLDFDMSPEQAVNAPRMHLEGDMLSFEPGFPESALAAMAQQAPAHDAWPAQNLFFGGVHTVSVSPDGCFDGAGDPRRGGIVEFA